MLRLQVNGEPHPHRGDGSLQSLLAETGARPERTAVMVNGRVVKKVDWAGVRLKENDQVEVLMFAAGG